MNCAYIYCRAPLPPGDRCEVCGYPTDASRVSDPTFVQETLATMDFLPSGIVDMHQIVPNHPKALGGQKLFMDAMGIEWAVLQSAPAEATSLVGNAGLAALHDEDPKRFIHSWYVDPREADAIEQLQAAHDNKARVIKLLPVAGYRLDEARFIPFFEAVQQLGFTLLIHTGFITARHKEEEARANKFLNSSYGDPLQVDEPARRFPDIPFIIAHSGGAIFHEAGAQLVTQHDNIYGDLSGFGIVALTRWLQLHVAVDFDKVFWGNDALCTAYPTNLKLLHHALCRFGREGEFERLVRDNGRLFRARHLS